MGCLASWSVMHHVASIGPRLITSALTRPDQSADAARVHARSTWFARLRLFEARAQRRFGRLPSVDSACWRVSKRHLAAEPASW